MQIPIPNRVGTGLQNIRQSWHREMYAHQKDPILRVLFAVWHAQCSSKSLRKCQSTHKNPCKTGAFWLADLSLFQIF